MVLLSPLMIPWRKELTELSTGVPVVACDRIIIIIKTRKMLTLPSPLGTNCLLILPIDRCL